MAWVVLLVSIVLVAFSGYVLHAQVQSPKSTVTIKPEIISESMNASDITEIWKLIDAGANINVINKYGANLLFVASQEGHAEVVRLLLEARAYVNIKIELRGKGNTALNLAEAGGHARIFELLNEYGRLKITH